VRDNSAGPRTSVREEVLKAAQALRVPHQGGAKGVTSDLSVDEALLLHSIGWEPADLVFGSGVGSVPVGAWNLGSGEIAMASASYATAFGAATKRLVDECARAGGHGVVGVSVESEVHRHHVDIELLGTAVRPIKPGRPTSIFSSDLSARDFVLLTRAGWRAVGMAFGASFAYVPRRSLGTTVAQKNQNVELTNFTEAMYSARESAMERLQGSALAMNAAGIVDVTVMEGPMHFAHHAIGFTAWGTAIKLDADAHIRLSPEMVLPVNDAVLEFEAASLRGT
jgi:uncharacterized protein YbjQ (UPF0145 family)